MSVISVMLLLAATAICLPVPAHAPPYLVQVISVRADGAGHACEGSLVYTEPNCEGFPCENERVYCDVREPGFPAWRYDQPTQDGCFQPMNELRVGWGLFYRVI